LSAVISVISGHVRFIKLTTGQLLAHAEHFIITCFGLLLFCAAHVANKDLYNVVRIYE